MPSLFQGDVGQLRRRSLTVELWGACLPVCRSPLCLIRHVQLTVYRARYQVQQFSC